MINKIIFSILKFIRSVSHIVQCVYNERLVHVQSYYTENIESARLVPSPC